MKWYYRDGDNQVGPITQEELFKLIEDDRLVESTLVWQDGWDEWKKLIDSGLVEVENEIIPPPLKPQEVAPPPLTSAQAKDVKKTATTNTFSLIRRRITGVLIDIGLVYLIGVIFSRLFVQTSFNLPWGFYGKTTTFFTFFVAWLAFNLWKKASPGQFIMGIETQYKWRKFLCLPAIVLRYIVLWCPIFFGMTIRDKAAIGSLMLIRRDFDYGVNTLTYLNTFVCISALLIVPLLFTKGRKTVHDWASGSATALKIPAKLSTSRKVLGIAIIAVSVIAHFCDFKIHTRGNEFTYAESTAKGSRFSAWFPANTSELSLIKEGPVITAQAVIPAKMISGETDQIRFSVCRMTNDEYDSTDAIEAAVESTLAEGDAELLWSRTANADEDLVWRVTKLSPENKKQATTYMARVSGDYIYILGISGSLYSDVMVVPEVAKKLFFGSFIAW